jgi:putative transposase
MVLLAHVRSAFALSNGTYGSPRMTEIAGQRPYRRQLSRSLKKVGTTPRLIRR